MRLISLLLLIVVYSCHSIGQSDNNSPEVSKRTQQIVEKIAENNRLMGGAVGYVGSRPEQFDNFQDLKETATKSELIQLTDHPNGVVRCYSFWALSHYPSAELYPIVVNHIDDTTYVETMFGCIVSMDRVGDFFIKTATPGYVDLDSKKLDSVQMKMLDSLLIHSETSLAARSGAIRRVEPTDDLYSHIRNLVATENNAQALITLAKYQREEDVELIRNFRESTDKKESGYYYTYRAIEEFPHPDFLPLLESNLKKTLDNTHYSSEWKALYQAIAVYQNEKAVELLSIPFTEVEHSNIRRYHINFLYTALENARAPIYEDLLWKLWIEESRITTASFQFLSERNPERVFEQSKASLLNTDALYKANIGLRRPNRGGTENLILTMLNLAFEQDSAFGMEALRSMIMETYVHLYPEIIKRVTELKDPSFVEPLFVRLEKEWNGYILVPTIEVLISYQNEEINQRILKTQKKNKNLKKGWAGERINELLRENKIE